jgi:hypothetical protein
MTSERRKTVGKAASVVRYVFAVQASSLPSGARLTKVREKLKIFVALWNSEQPVDRYEVWCLLVLVVCLDLGRHVRVGEYRQLSIRFRCNLDALYVLVGAKADVWWRVAGALDQLGTGMLVEHPLAEGAELFPFVAPVLDMTS